MEILPYSQEFLLEIAADWDDPAEICANHGVSAEEYEKLLDYEPFQKALAETRIALKDGMVTASFKAKCAVESLIPRLHKIARDSDDEKMAIDAFNALTKLGGLDKNVNPAEMGAGYTLVLNMGPQTLTTTAPPILEGDILTSD
jgi:hypothetical protein